MKSTTLSLWIGLGLGSCAPAEVTPAVQDDTTAADIEAIRAQTAEYVAASRANDLERLMALYAPLAVLMPPNQGAVRGLANVRAWNEAYWKRFRTEDYRMTSEAIQVAGDWAYRRATYRETFRPLQGGDSTDFAGKCVEIWQRQPDGSWKLALDIWNSDNPVPE